MMKRTLFALVAVAVTSVSALADVILTESFTYPDGPLVSGSGGIWATHSGTAEQVDISGGAASLTEAEGEDVSVTLPGEPFTAAANAILFARFTANFSGLPSGAGGYFAHFRNKATGFQGRVFASTNGAATGTLRLGVSFAGGTPNYLATDLTLNTAYTVLLKLDVAAGVATLWVNPTVETEAGVASTDAASAIAVSTFSLRQSLSSGSGMGKLTVDDLKIATTFAEALDNSPPPATPPVILTQPVSRTNVVNSTATFSVSAGGTAPLTYIWEKDKQDGLGTWEPVANATTATLTLTNVQLSDSGATYRVRVTNAVDAVLSAPATLTVIEDPTGTVRTIASLRTEVDPLNNTNNVESAALYLVEGIVTTHVSLTGAPNFLFYLQDDTGGVAVFWRNPTFTPKAGDKVRVKAPLMHFNGLLELTPNSATSGHEVTLVNGGNPVPAATAFDYGWLGSFAAIEAQEGRLITTANVTINPGADTTFRSTTYALTGPGGEAFNLFINSGTDLVGKPIPAGPATITGVLGQFDGSNPRDSGYQIIPTRYADLESTNKPPSVRFTNTLANLVRPGDLPVNTFTDHALRPGETITIAFEISDPDGKPVTVTLGNPVPAGAQWNFASLTGTTVTGTFTYTASAAAAGNAYPITVQAANATATFTQTINLYVPTAAEQQVVIAEFYANPTSDAAAPHFNPLNRAELLPGGNDASPSNRDEFIELVNLSGEPVDLTGWMLSDALQRRAYLYPGTPGTLLAASNAVVVYGGPILGYAPQLTVPAIAAEVGPNDPASTAGLALNNDGDTITLRNAASNIVARVVYVAGQTSASSSLTRFPTTQDAFVAHRSAGDRYWSPGVQPDGRAWTEPQENVDIVATAGVSAGNVTLNWSGPVGATYSVRRGGSPAGPFETIATGLTSPTFSEATADRANAFYQITSP